MKFTLKDYQDDAVRDVLTNLRKAKKYWRIENDITSFSLTATTGAGKTVMAAAVFEALFRGNDDFDFEGDPSAVVIWFSDDPSLNEQTRFRLMEASDKLNHNALEVVQTSFNQERFDAGKVYFLNTQKLGKKSLLVRGFDYGDGGDLFPETRPDMRSFTIWDTIKNTIEDPDLTLYLVLDEAHRGMKANNRSDKETIVKRLINGTGSAVPAIPVVWGISATIDRFDKAMADAQGRIKLNNVVVDAAKVQESGLLKDTIVLDIPDEVGQFDMVLVRRATDKIREASQAWQEYAEQQKQPKTVKPLMVLQVQNKPDHDDIGRAIAIIHEQWSELESDAIAHVFGEHTPQTFGAYTVPYITPERVQDSTHVRVLIAKDAISTGWDCPRAEVMVSFRPAKDKTHITQLLGRMVRTPLARRIPGNERLNAVDCLLPLFDTKTVKAVSEALMHGSADDGGDNLGRRVLINSVKLLPNPDVPQSVWDTLTNLPSQTLPKKAAKPIQRLTSLAHELAYDGLLKNAGSKAHAEMHVVLDGAQVRYADAVQEARKAVLTVEGKSLSADMKTGKHSFDDFVEAADYAVIADAYRRAGRVLNPSITKSYAEHLAGKFASDIEEFEEALMDAHTDIAALSLVPEVKVYLETEADNLAKSWFDEYRIQLKDLSDERQEIYRDIKAWSTAPENVEVARPATWMEATAVQEENGTESPIPTYQQHLLCDEDGNYPALLNEWETTVLQKEMARDGFVAWYRNPARTSQDSLGVAYLQNEEYKIMRPDFIFFSEKPDGSIVADIVDPHGHHLSDALPKLQGLAAFAEKYGDAFRRIDAVAEVDGVLRVLDMQDANIRKMIATADDAKGAYLSTLHNKF